MEDVKEEKEQEEKEQEKEESVISENIRENVSNIRHAIFLFLIYSFGLLISPISPINIQADILWKNYSDKCCSYIYNATRCSLSFNCEETLMKWLGATKTPKSIYDTCCYWFAPFTSWRLNSHAFCNPLCLHP